MLYGRQEIRVPTRLSTFRQIGYVIGRYRCGRRELSVRVVFTVTAIWLSLKLLGCYMVKPHGQLVLVSFIHY